MSSSSTDYSSIDNPPAAFSSTYTAIIVIIIIAVIVKICLIAFCCMRISKRNKARQQAYSMNNVNGTQNTSYNPGNVEAGRPVWNNGGGLYRPQDAQGNYAKVPNVMNEPLPVYTRDRSPSPGVQGYENGR